MTMKTIKTDHDREARKKIEGITKRLDAQTNAVENHDTEIDRLFKRMTILERLHLSLERAASSTPKPSIRSSSRETLYKYALERIRSTGCRCRYLAPAGSPLHSDSPTMPLEGVDHLATCHVAIAAKALGR